MNNALHRGFEQPVGEARAAKPARLENGSMASPDRPYRYHVQVTTNVKVRPTRKQMSTWTPEMAKTFLAAIRSD
jgi:hypothetical protein